VHLIEPAFDDLRGPLRLDPQIVRWAVKTAALAEVIERLGKAAAASGERPRGGSSPTCPQRHPV
jgi:hypothetical protein